MESHLAEFIRKGELDIREIVPDSTRLAWIMNAIGQSAAAGLTRIKEQLGDNVGYGEIRAVLNYYYVTGTGIINR